MAATLIISAEEANPVEQFSLRSQPRLGDWQNTKLLEYVKQSTRQLERQQDRMMQSLRQGTSPTLAKLKEIMEIERARHLTHDRRDKLSQQNRVLIQKEKYLTEADATRSQKLYQTHREIHRMCGEMA